MTERQPIHKTFFATVFVCDQDVPLPPFPKIDIAEDSVLKAIRRITPSKSPGPGNLHSYYIYETAESIEKPLKILFKTSREASKLPSAWKEVTVTPILCII